MCRLTGMSRAGFYRSRQHSDAEETECRLWDEVERLALRWPAYGSRRITAALRKGGWEVNRKHVQRIMRVDSLLCLRQPTSWLRTTDSSHQLPVFPNLVAKLEVTALNQLWVADITYIRLQHEFVFLAAILDAFSRRVVGWSLDRSMEAALCIRALEQALRSRRFAQGLIHHSDRGAQYCSREYVELLARHAIRGSMSRQGNPYDNALAERFWRTLKYEQVYREQYRSLEQARGNIDRFIGTIYNRQRLHSALGYCSPAEFETMTVVEAVE